MFKHLYFFRYMFALCFVQYFVPLVLISFAYIRISVVRLQGHKPGVNLIKPLRVNLLSLFVSETVLLVGIVPRSSFQKRVTKILPKSCVSLTPELAFSILIVNFSLSSSGQGCLIRRYNTIKITSLCISVNFSLSLSLCHYFLFSLM